MMITMTLMMITMTGQGHDDDEKDDFGYDYDDFDDYHDDFDDDYDDWAGAGADPRPVITILPCCLSPVHACATIPSVP